MKRIVVSLASLVVLLFLLDQAYRVLHPHVNLVRATLVGASGLGVLLVLRMLGARLVSAWTGGGAIFASAFLSVLLIDGGVLVSRSPISAVVHVVILVAAWLALDALAGTTRESARSARRIVAS